MLIPAIGLDNRQAAVLFWIAALLALVLSKEDIRRSLARPLVTLRSPKLSLVLAARGGLDDLRAEALAAEAGVLVGFGPAEAVVDVQGRDAVPERRQHVPEAGRVGAARDEDGDVTSRRDEALVPNERLNALENCLFGHS